MRRGATGFGACRWRMPLLCCVLCTVLCSALLFDMRTSYGNMRGDAEDGQSHSRYTLPSKDLVQALSIRKNIAATNGGGLFAIASGPVLRNDTLNAIVGNSPVSSQVYFEPARFPQPYAVCQAGTYFRGWALGLAEEKLTVCLPCPKGTFSATVGVPNIDGCILCPIGASTNGEPLAPIVRARRSVAMDARVAMGVRALYLSSAGRSAATGMRACRWWIPWFCPAMRSGSLALRCDAIRCAVLCSALLCSALRSKLDLPSRSRRLYSVQTQMQSNPTHSPPLSPSPPRPMQGTARRADRSVSAPSSTTRTSQLALVTSARKDQPWRLAVTRAGENESERERERERERAS